MQRTDVVVADEKDGRTISVHGVFFNQRAIERKFQGVAIAVNGAAAASAWGSLIGRIAAVARADVIREHAVIDGPRNTDAADAASVRAGVAIGRSSPKRAVHHVDGQALRLAENSHGRSTHIRPLSCADVGEKPAIHDFEAPASNPDGAPAAPVIAVVYILRIAIDES